MKCVHGIEMEVFCHGCHLENEGSLKRTMFFGSVSPEFQTEPQDRLATELAYLTRSIQGLSVNVAKLVEEMTSDDVPSYCPIGGKENQNDQREINRSRSALVENLIVKRGPLIEKEIKAAIVAAENFSSATKIGYTAMHRALETLAKSRGLID